MKLRFLAFNLILIGFLSLIPPSAYSAAERRVALVIGNGAYRSIPALRNPVNDAEDMARALESCGFTVIKKINADRGGMRQALVTFSDQIRLGGVGLFFYAGHGVQVDGHNYLVPIDAQVQRKFEVEDECMRASAVLRAMEEAKNRLNIIILDACRDNPFKSFRSTDRGLSRMDAPTGSLLVYATAPDKKADDGPARNGLYTSYFLKHMLTPGQSIMKTLMQVREEVMQATNGQQVPWESSSIVGDFFFIPAIAATTTGVDRPSPMVTTPAPVTPPSTGTVPDYDRIIREREQAEKQWAAWQARMESEFAKAQSYDLNPRLKPQEKAGLWQAFLSGFAQDNPNSTKDEDLRLKAQERLDYWRQQATVPAPSPQVAAVTPSDAARTLTGLLKYANGVIFDPKTNLEWYAGPDRDTKWNDADQWVRSLSVAGGGWRLPTLDELRGLYKQGVGSRNMDPAFETTGWWVWSGEARDSLSEWCFDFLIGADTWGTRYTDPKDRAFAVRSRQSAVPAPSPQVAAITPSTTDATRTLTGLLKYANGVIFDPNTNLEWYVGPDNDTNWKDADQWVSSLSVAGGGWRPPTKDELRDLFKPGVGSRNMDPAFGTTGWWVWSMTRGSLYAWPFPFTNGGAGWGGRGYDGSLTRAFAVRSRR